MKDPKKWVASPALSRLAIEALEQKTAGGSYTNERLIGAISYAMCVGEPDEEMFSNESWRKLRRELGDTEIKEMPRRKTKHNKTLRDGTGYLITEHQISIAFGEYHA